MKVLYVEDNPANVFLVKRVARMGQHEVVNYIDGNQAIQKFDEIKPDLVLMDIQLAGDKSGLDVVKELRANGVETPIIAVTAYAMVGDKERCIEAGCTDYLAKPLPIPRLVEIFKKYENEATAKAESATQATIKTVDKAETRTNEKKTDEASTESPAETKPETVTTHATENSVETQSETAKNEDIEEVASNADTKAEDNKEVASDNEENVVTSADDDTIVKQNNNQNKTNSTDATDQPTPSANVAVNNKKEASTGGSF